MNFLEANQLKSSALVTVVVPAFNHARYITETLDSVRQQTFSNWEMIVIDDGSTDETWAVLEAYAEKVTDSRIRILRQSNAGSHATINRAMHLAKTPYMAILNSDDVYGQDRLSQLLKAAEAAGPDVFIATGVQLIDGSGAPVAPDHWWQSMYRSLLDCWVAARGAGSDNPAVDALLWGNFTISTSNFFMSRSVWQKVGEFKHLRYVPDWDYALRVAAELPAVFIFLPDEASLKYRLHGRNTILGGQLRNHAEAVRVLRAFLKKWAAAGHHIPAHAIDRLYYLMRFMRHEHTRQLLERQKLGELKRLAVIGVRPNHIQEDLAKISTQSEELRVQLDDLHQQCDQFRQQAASSERLVLDLTQSTSWRATAPLRYLKRMLASLKRQARQSARRFLTQAKKPLQLQPAAYDNWLVDESAFLNQLKEKSAGEIQAMKGKPFISIVMPVHNTPENFLREAIASVQAQWYESWELCICNDASTDPVMLKALADIEKLDARIKCVHRTTSGHIVQATNSAIDIATGEFTVFLDHDDLLAPHALFILAQALSQTPDADLLYSDEDKVDEQGKRCLPFFKPDWSPVLQWSQNYIGHLMCLRSSLLRQVGGLLIGTQGSQDHDLVLRFAAQGARIVHVPHVLYHWRMHAASTSANPLAKPYAHTAGKESVGRHLSLRYPDQFDRVDDGDNSFVYSPRFKVGSEALASIIIPTLDKPELLKACIDSIRAKTVGASYEIIILDNGSKEKRTQDYFRQLTREANIRVIAAHIPFNWSRLNNIGRQHANGQVLVFLNNDTEVISPDWLHRLMEYALLPDVATVGALLLYPDDTIQHAGVVVGMGGWADHVFKNTEVVHYPSPFVSSLLPRNVLANTGACMAVSTSCFDLLGGFDETFQICGSDVELGIRAHKQGYSNVYLPTARLYHLESKTRSPEVPAVDFEQSAIKYAPYRLNGDPFYNCNLDPMQPRPIPRYPSAHAASF